MELSKRSQKKVDSIVEHASKLFVRPGFQKITMEAIAQYANVSKVTLYKYFKDKQTLYEHILIENTNKDFQDIKDIVFDRVSYPDKVTNLFQMEINNYYDLDRPNVDESIILSLDTSKHMKKHIQRMKRHRQKLYNQGRMEEFICEDVSDHVLDAYYFIVREGLINEYRHIQKLSEEDQAILYQTLFSGIQKCHE